MKYVVVAERESDLDFYNSQAEAEAVAEEESCKNGPHLVLALVGRVHAGAAQWTRYTLVREPRKAGRAARR